MIRLLLCLLLTLTHAKEQTRRQLRDQARQKMRAKSAPGEGTFYGPAKLGVQILKPGYKPMDRPSKGTGKPDVVDVGIKLMNLQEVSDVDMLLGVNLLFQMKWKDARLAGIVKKEESPMRIDAMQIWTPGVAIANAASPPDLMSEGFRLYEDGTVELTRNGLYTAVVDVNVGWFPFDSQAMEIMFECPDYDGSQVMFVIDQGKSTTDVGGEEIWELDRWSVVQQIMPSVVNGEPDSYLVGTAVVRRLFGMAMVNLVVPLYVIANFSFMAFFVYLGDFPTRVGIVSTGFLTLIAFLFVVQESLPKIAYWTWMHLYLIVTIIFVLIVQIEVVLVHYLDPHDTNAELEAMDGVDKKHASAKEKIAIERAKQGAALLDDVTLPDEDFDNEEMVRHIFEAFEEIDTNKSGGLDAEELKVALVMIGVTNPSRQTCLDIIEKYSFPTDADKTKLSFPNFIVYALDQHKSGLVVDLDGNKMDRSSVSLIDTVGADTTLFCGLGPRAAMTIDHWTKRIAVVGYTFFTIVMLIAAGAYRDNYTRQMNSALPKVAAPAAASAFFRR